MLPLRSAAVTLRPEWRLSHLFERLLKYSHSRNRVCLRYRIVLPPRQVVRTSDEVLRKHMLFSIVSSTLSFLDNAQSKLRSFPDSTVGLYLQPFSGPTGGVGSFWATSLFLRNPPHTRFFSPMHSVEMPLKDHRVVEVNHPQALIIHRPASSTAILNTNREPPL